MIKLAVAKSGSDAKSAPDEDLLLTSENNTLKIFIDRKDTVTSLASLNIAHGLSYIPMFMVFVNAGGGSWSPCVNQSNAVVTANTTNISIVSTDILGDDQFRTIGFVDKVV